MWGNFFAESTYLQNFTFGFPNKQSDILLHLTHWQYWFWFWFTYFLVLYYFIFLRLIRFRSQKFSPKLATSFRSHGKWGDLLVCFLPLSWCTNILSNSNFILRMIEWQSESSLFTLRIRGKQWYWVYKMELKVLTDVSNTVKNIGYNNYIQQLNYTENNLFFIKFKHDLMYNYLSWKNVTANNNKINSNVSTYYTPTNTTNNSNTVLPSLNFIASPLNEKLSANNSFYSSKSSSLSQGVALNTSNLSSLQQYSASSAIGSKSTPLVSRTNKLNSSYTPLRLLSTKKDLLTVSFFKNNFIKKPFNNNLFLVIKQKRFSAPSFNNGTTIFKDVSYNYYGANLKNLNSYMNEHFNITSVKNAINNKRLLRTRRILVLPTKTNITLITNSFDVMHSWYVPGLGVKLDCVPGRSTHHVIHIDHTGFYYGQCAEICGRYHHHMPIRICSLPFNHFILWWWNYGAPFFLQKNGERLNQVNNSMKQYNW